MKRFDDSQAEDILKIADAFIAQAEKKAPDDPAYAETLASLKQQLDDIRPVLAVAPSMLFFLEEVLLLWGPRFAKPSGRLDQGEYESWLRGFVYQIEEKALHLIPDDSPALKSYPDRKIPQW